VVDVSLRDEADVTERIIKEYTGAKKKKKKNAKANWIMMLDAYAFKL